MSTDMADEDETMADEEETQLPERQAWIEYPDATGPDRFVPVTLGGPNGVKEEDFVPGLKFVYALPETETEAIPK